MASNAENVSFDDVIMQGFFIYKIVCGVAVIWLQEWLVNWMYTAIHPPAEHFPSAVILTSEEFVK